MPTDFFPEDIGLEDPDRGTSFISFRPFVKTVFGVAELIESVNSRLRENYASVTVEGELHQVRRSAQGHFYLTLRDRRENAILEATFFRFQQIRNGYQPRVGDLVSVRGTLNIYAPSGRFSLNVESMEPAGLGALFERYCALKEKLRAQGLFDAQRKKRLPRFPGRIAVVTSPEAAALADVTKTLRAAAGHVQFRLYPCLVQGEGSLDSILDALRAVERERWADVVLLVRGGGSIADLWTFNEERLALAIGMMRTPVIAGVGHETDETIADFVADWRAATPTAAAQKAVENWVGMMEHLDALDMALFRAVSRRLEQATDAMRISLRLQTLVRRTTFESQRRLMAVRDLEPSVNRALMEFDRRSGMASDRLEECVSSALERRRVRIGELVGQLQAMAPNRGMAGKHVDLLNVRMLSAVSLRLAHNCNQSERLRERMDKVLPDLTRLWDRALRSDRDLTDAMDSRLQSAQEQLGQLQKRLSLLDVDNALMRGFAIVFDETGAIVRDASAVTTDQRLDVRLRNGVVRTRVVEEDRNNGNA